MKNYYEYIELDINASEDEITSALNRLSTQDNIDLQKLREIKSILLNEQAKKLYDEKLIQFILNKNSLKNKFNHENITNAIKLDNTALHDSFIYIAIMLSLLSITSNFIFGLNVNLAISFVVMALMLVVLFMDWKLLQAHGKASFSKWWILITPVYIFKRCKAIDAGKKLFFTWVAITILYVVIKATIAGGTAFLENTACDTVTEIYHSQLQQYESCENVTITDSDGKEHYGFAEISDGSTRDITVTERQGGDIYVTILEE